MPFYPRGLLDYETPVQVTGRSAAPLKRTDTQTDEPSVLGVASGAVTGSGTPTIRKPGALGSYPRTSPVSIAARSVLSNDIKVPKIPTPTLGNIRATPAGLASLVGRGVPALGLFGLLADVAMAEDGERMRTLAGDAGGVLGGAAGATLASPSVVGTIAGGLGGAYAGNKLGLLAYDTLMGPPRR